METRDILNELKGIKQQAMVAIQTNELLLQNATNLEKKISQDEGHVDGPRRRKVNQGFEQKATSLLMKRRLHYQKGKGA